MLSYDGVTSHFEQNPYFKGAWFHNSLPGGNASANYIPMLDENNEQMLDSQGNAMYLVIPQIEKIAFTVGDYDIRTDENGSYYIGENSSIHKIPENEVHLVNKVVNGTAIVDGMGLMGEGVRTQAYPRIGLSFLTFTYDWPTVHEKEVRQAIAWCMDREQITEDYCGAPMAMPAAAEEEEGTEGGEAEPANILNFGEVMDGYYGREQWEYLLVTHQLDYPVNMIDEVLPEVHTVDEEEELLKYQNRYVRTQAEFDSALAAWETLSLENLVHYGVYDLENDPERTEKTGIAKVMRRAAGRPLLAYVLDALDFIEPEKTDIVCFVISWSLAVNFLFSTAETTTSALTESLSAGVVSLVICVHTIPPCPSADVPVVVVTA